MQVVSCRIRSFDLGGSVLVDGPRSDIKPTFAGPARFPRLHGFLIFIDDEHTNDIATERYDAFTWSHVRPPSEYLGCEDMVSQ